MPIQQRTCSLPNDSNSSLSSKADSNKSDERAYSTPKRPSTTVSERTPKKRRQYGSSTPSVRKKDARKKIVTASNIELPNSQESLCAITNHSDRQSLIHCSHIIATSVTAHDLAVLEYCWNMPYGKLNVDSHYNIQTVSSLLHDRFDRAHGWFWVPSDLKTVFKLHKKYVDGTARYDPCKVYKTTFFPYKLVAHNDMNMFTFTRYYGSHEPSKFNDDHETKHRYPYSKLANINLHIYPHYIIYHTGKKISSHIGDENLTAETARNLYRIEAPSELFDILVKVLDIYRAWMSVNVPPHFKKGKSKSTKARKDKDPGGSGAGTQNGPHDGPALKSSQSNFRHGMQRRSHTLKNQDIQGPNDDLPDDSPNSDLLDDLTFCTENPSNPIKNGDDHKCGRNDSDNDSLSGFYDSDNYDDISDAEFIERIDGWREDVSINVDNLEASTSALFESSGTLVDLGEDNEETTRRSENDKLQETFADVRECRTPYSTT